MAFIERRVKEVEWNDNNVGIEIEGSLWLVEEVQYKDGIGIVYTVKSKKTPGEIIRFRGAKQLNSILHQSDVGKPVRIRYDGEDKSKPINNGMHYPKRFTVAVDELDESFGNPSITDSDVPF
jgi:hypothetical protein